jgi:hypothetical protein
VLDHLDDLASDFSAVHGIRDMGELDGPAFFKLAYRMTAYRGVMRELAIAEQQDDEPRPAPPAAAPAPAPPPPPAGGGVNMVAPTRAALQSEPAFNGIFSFGTAGGGS